MSSFGIVVIGRNEGERLAASLSSLDIDEYAVLYVDSCSTDGSPQLARNYGVNVLELDPTSPLSASRARNEGLSRLIELHPSLDFVQFLDGDSMLCEGWLEVACATLQDNPKLCAVTGWLHEKDSERSLIKQVCLIDYRLPEGEIHCFCGNSFVRVGPFLEVGGFNAGIPAGEEPELSQRLTSVGWRILSIQNDMAIHDSGHMTLAIWLKRATRSGYAYAQVLSSSKDRLWGRFGFRQSIRTWFWTLVLCALMPLSLLVSNYGSLAVLCLLLVQLIRVGVSSQKSLKGLRVGFVYACLWYLGLWAQLLGQIRFLKDFKARRSADPKEPTDQSIMETKREGIAEDSVESD